MQNKQNRRPLIDPLVLVLKSRRVIVALAGMAVGLLLLALPDLKAVQHELLALVITLSLALIGGYSVEDAATAARQAPTDDDLAARVEALVRAIIEESSGHSS